MECREYGTGNATPPTLDSKDIRKDTDSIAVANAFHWNCIQHYRNQYRNKQFN